MQESIEARRRRRKREAVRGAAVFMVFQIAMAALFGWMCLLPDMPGWCVVLFGALSVLSIALIVPAILVLRGRFHEIEGGELDAAGKY